MSMDGNQTTNQIELELGNLWAKTPHSRTLKSCKLDTLDSPQTEAPYAP